MKMYKYVLGYTNVETKAAWDRYSQTGAAIDKPSGTGTAPHVVMSNQRRKGAKRWSKRCR